MKLSKVLLGATLALGLATFGSDEEVKAAEWEARTAEEVKADFQAIDNSQKTYTIQWGDTLGVIANAAQMNMDTLVEINNINNADLIFPGNKLSFKEDENGQVAEVTVENVSTATVETYAVAETYAPAETAAVQEYTPATQVDAAVATAASQPAANVSSSVPYYVYQVIEAEAGPGAADISNVASVIYNRAASGDWGGTDAYSVVTASGQFEVDATGAASATVPSQATIDIVNSVFAGSTTTSAESFRASGDGVTNYFF